MEETKNDSQEHEEDEESEETSASDEITYALADLLRSQQLLDGLKGGWPRGQMKCQRRLL